MRFAVRHHAMPSMKRTYAMIDVCLFVLAFLTKNLEFMRICIMAGFNLRRMEPWIKEYLENPDFIDYPDYYVKRATNSLDNSANRWISDGAQRTEQELNEMIYLDEYFYNRYHSSSNKRKSCADHKRNSADQAKHIYSFIKHTSSNTLSLMELSRIAVRKAMVSSSSNMRESVEGRLHIPRRLKEYLLFKEFNL